MREFDLVVIGAGVAGLTAAMHAGRYGLSVAVVERMGVGGQIAAAERIENFPGFPQGVSGAELGPLLHEQAEAAGAEFSARHCRKHRHRWRLAHCQVRIGDR